MTSESLTGPDGRTSTHALSLARTILKVVEKMHPTTRIGQTGYGPAYFDVDLGDHLIATVTVEVKRSRTQEEE